MKTVILTYFADNVKAQMLQDILRGKGQMRSIAALPSAEGAGSRIICRIPGRSDTESLGLFCVRWALSIQDFFRSRLQTGTGSQS